jgi:Mlc titration factor MtfA (ptsG expression regulator)
VDGEHADRFRESRIDAYAAENPAEFFAVLSEAFFEIPHVVRDEYPEVYRQLAAFYRQDPATRIAPQF